MFSLPASAMLENRHVTKCEATGSITGMQLIQTCESAKGARKDKLGMEVIYTSRNNISFIRHQVSPLSYGKGLF